MPTGLKLGARTRLQSTDRGHELQTGAHRPLGVVLGRLRVPKIHEHAVAHVFGDETAEPAHRVRHVLAVGRDHLAQIFGIELG